MKTLAFVTPGGHNLIIEWDIFYPLPTTWHIEKQHPPAPPPEKDTDTSPPPTTEMTDDSFEDHNHHSGEIWVPPSGWSPDTDVIKSISDDKRRIWSNSNVRNLIKLI